jgi:hypothetical protein
VPSVGRNGGNKVRGARISEEDMTPAHQILGVGRPAREWWTCSIPSACARSGILVVCLIVRRSNAARMSMMPFSLVEMYAESRCYNRRAYAPCTRVWHNADCGATARASYPRTCSVPLRACVRLPSRSIPLPILPSLSQPSLALRKERHRICRRTATGQSKG